MAGDTTKGSALNCEDALGRHTIYAPLMHRLRTDPASLRKPGDAA